jgi:hypothetical protein
MAHVILVLLCIAFVELFILLDLRRNFAAVAVHSREGISVLISSRLDDEEKEIIIRRKALDLFLATVLMVGKFLVIAVLAYSVYLLASPPLPESKEELAELLFSPWGLALLTGVTIGYVWVRNAVRKKLQSC